MNVLNRDDLIAEVAARHKVLLDDKDPILVTLTLSELVLGRYVEKINALGADHQKALAAALAQQLVLAKETGGRIITDAADYAAGEIRKAVEAATTSASAISQRDIAAAQAASRAALDGAHVASVSRTGATGAAIFAGVAAVIALVAMVIALVK